MMSLLDLISQNQPHFQTHQALLVIGLQNDFLRPDGKVPVDSRSGFVERIKIVTPKFRQNSGNIIWIQTLFENERDVNDPSNEGDTVVLESLDGMDSASDDDGDELPKDLIAPVPSSRGHRHKQRALDLLKRVSAKRRVPARTASPSPAEEDELFLSRSSKKGPSCLPNTTGVDFADNIKCCIEPSTDTIVRTSHYSAFNGTNLLLILRAKLVTEVYICGCLTNISVFATVLDAARHGIKINVIGDCLGYRKQARHDEALKKMVDYIEAEIVTSKDLADGIPKHSDNRSINGQRSSRAEDELQNLVGNLRLDDDSSMKEVNTARSTRSITPSITVNGRQRTFSDASVPESMATQGSADTALSDEQFAERLSLGARTTRSPQSSSAAKPGMVKSKIRMRSRSDKKKKGEDKKEDSSKPEGSSAGKSATQSTPPVEPPPASPLKSPKKIVSTAEPPPRAAAITKAESSDKLRESTSRKDQKLKYSSSQPALSSQHLDQECKDKDKTTKGRLSLSRAIKSDQSSTSKSTPPRTPTAETTPATTMSKKPQSLATFPVLGPKDKIAEGDSRIIYDFFPPDYRHPTDPTNLLKDVIFQHLYNEVRWQKMSHVQGEVPRLVCVQGEFGVDGSMPVYRHPSDQALPLLHFTPKVQVIRKQAEKLVGHGLNHVLIQLYRSGQDYISEHSDKTLDIVRGSSIVNVSFGAQRTMRLRTKKSAKSDEASADAGPTRNTERVAMPHNSMFVLGAKSNMRWLHGIGADKRQSAERSDAEKAYSGMRISLTFRHIGTFLDSDSRAIWGQGATSKDRASPQDVINDDEEETEKMIRAFSKENHDTEFDWDDTYGDGFDVLHFRTPPEDEPILFTSNNIIENRQIQICLAELGLRHIVCEIPTCERDYEVDRQVAYRDTNIEHTEIVSTVPILLYLDRYHTLDRDDRGKDSTAGSYDLLILLTALRKFWINRAVPTVCDDFVNMLETVEERQALNPGPFIAGQRFSIGDCYMWPVLDEMISEWDQWSQERFPALTTYYQMLWKKKKSVGRLRTKLPRIK